MVRARRYTPKSRPRKGGSFAPLPSPLDRVEGVYVPGFRALAAAQGIDPDSVSVAGDEAVERDLERVRAHEDVQRYLRRHSEV